MGASPERRGANLKLMIARYTTDHEWVTLDSESNIGTVGITDYAQKALGDVVFVELPAVGTEIAQGGTSSRHRCSTIPTNLSPLLPPQSSLSSSCILPVTGFESECFVSGKLLDRGCWRQIL